MNKVLKLFLYSLTAFIILPIISLFGNTSKNKGEVGPLNIKKASADVPGDIIDPDLSHYDDNYIFDSSGDDCDDGGDGGDGGDDGGGDGC